jgi:signal peptide peptidase SppA
MAFTDRLRSMFGKGTTIPVVRINGAIGMAVRFQRGVSLETVAGPLQKAFSMSAPAVAVIVNSPGGSPVQSHLIFKRIRSLAGEKNKKVLVFVEDVAASGGYMVACAGDEIIADPSSIVGSIGVISAGFGFEKLIGKIGVERRVHSAGDRKSMLDPFLPENPDDVRRLEAIQREVHAGFIDLVRGRRTRLADDPHIFSGDFWTGTRGLELGLVDRIGDLRTVLKERFGKDVRARVIGAPGGLMRRLGFSQSLVADGVDALAAAVNEMALWRRFGL